MIIKNICVYNMYPAILGIRNALKSKNKSDSIQKNLFYRLLYYKSYNHCIIGVEDEKLIKKLLKGKLAHQERKFMRQILVSMDIKGSIKFWAQMDTFKIATVRNSESTMHCITKNEVTQDDFERKISIKHLGYLNFRINIYNKLKDSRVGKTLNAYELEEINKKMKNLFEDIDANLPGGYLLESHWTGNYENLKNIYHSRKLHKMYWWKEFCQYIEQLPYFDLLINETWRK